MMRTDNHFYSVVSKEYGQFELMPSLDADGNLYSADLMFCKDNSKHGWRYTGKQIYGLMQTLKSIRYLGSCENSEQFHIFKPEACMYFGDDDDDHAVLAWYELSDGGVGLNFSNIIEITDMIDEILGKYHLGEVFFRDN